MEPTQSKPPRKRRRWLIVAFVLVLVGVAWWNWPRGDARFVGKWRLHEEYALGEGTEFHLHANGIYETALGALGVLGEWRVTGEHFEFGRQTVRGRDALPLWAYISQVFHPEQRGLIVESAFGRYQIRSVAEDLIRLQVKDDYGVMRHYELKRIPE